MVGVKLRENLITVMLWLSALLITLILLGITGYIAIRGIAAINWSFIIEVPRQAGAQGGILTAIVSTIAITFLALLIAVPIGVGTALYLQEYASSRGVFTNLVNLATETLAGIPSIVFGLFGFIFLVIFLGMGWSLLSGSLTLAMMVLPTITKTAQEAIMTVPQEYRESSLALGADRWQTICKVILPSAWPGIVTGIILSTGRATGETAALVLTAGSALGMPLSLSDPARTMAVHLYILAMEGISLEKAFGTALLLLILVVFINSLARLSLRVWSTARR